MKVPLDYLETIWTIQAKLNKLRVIILKRFCKKSIENKIIAM